MNILIVTGSIDRSEQLLFEYLAAQDENNVCVLGEPTEENAGNLKRLGARVELFTVKHRLDLSAIHRIKTIIRNEKIDIIYSPTNRGLATSLFATRRTHLPVVTYRGTLGNLSYLSPASRIAHLHPRVSTIACNCEAVHNFLLTLGVSQAKLVKVYKGHKPEWYAAKPATTLAELGVPKTKFVIGCVANIRPLKGIDFLIKACKELENEFDFQLVLIGENRDKTLLPLIQSLQMEKRVHFIGFRKDATSLMKHFDVAVMPSTKREGLARSVVEAQLQGIPAIVSDIGGLPEIVEHMKTGLVCKSSDVNSLKLALKHCLEEPKKLKSYGEAASIRASEKFSTTTYVKTMENVFKSALAPYKRLNQQQT